jgi:hypothetical protein
VAERGAKRRLEETRTGRWLISAFVVVLLTAMLLSALPDSELVDATTPWRRPITDVTGLVQSWELFAPNPGSITERLEARLTYADGSIAHWYPPSGDRLLGAYRSFRWRKWASRVMADDEGTLQVDAAVYIASVNRRNGELPSKVELARLTYDAPPVGSGLRRDPMPDWEREVLYSWDRPAEFRRAAGA